MVEDTAGGGPLIKCGVKTGNEPLTLSGVSVGTTVLEFWRWAQSDLLGNTLRGVFAEFIVAQALGIRCDEPRDAWAVVDLVTPEGIKVEVKSAAYVQSWFQKRHSLISFGYRATKPWDSTTGEHGSDAKRSANVYVFCLLKTKDRTKADPLNLDEWEFYVVPTAWLDKRERSQTSVTLASLTNEGQKPVAFNDLRSAVVRASAASPATQP